MAEKCIYFPTLQSLAESATIKIYFGIIAYNNRGKHLAISSSKPTNVFTNVFDSPGIVLVN